MKIVNVFVLMSFLLLGACSSTQVLEEDKTLGGVKPSPEVAADEASEVQSVSESESLETKAHIPLVINPSVQKWLNYYQGNGRKHMVRYLERASQYTGFIKRLLKEESLPEDLVYLPIIESGFSSRAYSHAGAVGYWQFIRATGKRYGLKISSDIDERRDIYLSTKAAAQYLKTLYGMFDDWYLALASYNAGEGRIKRLVRRYKTKDFFELQKKRRMPRETKNYIPKFLAAVHIAKDPKKYGFTNIEALPPLEHDNFYVKQPISLLKLAKNMNIPFKELKVLNPRYRSDFVPIYKEGQSVVRVPKGSKAIAMAALFNSRSDKPIKYERDFYYYKIRRGDSLSRIAHKNRVRMSSIMAMNNLSRRSLLRIGRVLRIPERGRRSLRSKKVATRRAKIKKNLSKASLIHKVRRGENLSLIASKYGVGISKLKRLNGLNRRAVIGVGQKLVIRVQEAEPVDTASTTNASFHIVKAGDTLIGITKKYKIGLSQLTKLNDMMKSSKLYVGRRLKLK